MPEFVLIVVCFVVPMSLFVWFALWSCFVQSPRDMSNAAVAYRHRAAYADMQRKIAAHRAALDRRLELETKARERRYAAYAAKARAAR